MNGLIKRIPINLIITAVILLLLILFINCVQMTLGRYVSSFERELGFAFTSKQSFEISYGDWQEAAGKQTLLLRISNSDVSGGSTRSGSVRIRLFIPDIDSLSNVKIDFNNKEYTADISAVPIGTSIYKTNGEGSICRFYDDQGKEIAFDISSLTTDDIYAMLTLITETNINTNGIKIIIEPINSQGKGGNQI